MFKEDIALTVARILTHMAAPPNPHRVPTDRDLTGNFDLWFDDGAVKHDTGISAYRFIDGSAATTGSSLRFAVHIRLADGRLLELVEKERHSLDPGALIGLE
jgi:hypothetical protein